MNSLNWSAPSYSQKSKESKKTFPFKLVTDVVERWVTENIMNMSDQKDENIQSSILFPVYSLTTLYSSFGLHTTLGKD